MNVAIIACFAAIFGGLFGITVHFKNKKIRDIEAKNRELAIGKAHAEHEAKKESQRADAADAGKDLNVKIANALRSSTKESLTGTGTELSEEDKKNAENIMSRDITY